MKKSIINPVLFGIVLVSFFLPFFNLSCQGQEIMQATGFELITGVKPPQMDNLNNTLKMTDPNMSFTAEPSEEESEPLAIWLLGATITGLALSFVKKYTTILSAVMSGIGILLTYLLGNEIESKVMTNESAMMLRINFEIGYYIMLLSFAGLLIFNLYEILTVRKPKPAPESSLYSEAQVFCPNCGNLNSSSAQFCQGCGTKL